MSNLGNIIELPLKAIQYILHFILDYGPTIVVIALCGYVIYRVWKWSKKKRQEKRSVLKYYDYNLIGERK